MKRFYIVLLLVLYICANANSIPCPVANFSSTRFRAFIVSVAGVARDESLAPLTAALDAAYIPYDINTLVNEQQQKVYFGEFQLYDYDGIGKYSTIIFTSFPMTFIDKNGIEQDALLDSQLAQLREYAHSTNTRIIVLGSLLGPHNILPGLAPRPIAEVAERAGTLVLKHLGRFHAMNFTGIPIWTYSEPVYVLSENERVVPVASVLRNVRLEEDVAICIYNRSMPYDVQELHAFLTGDELNYKILKIVINWAYKGLGVTFPNNCGYVTIELQQCSGSPTGVQVTTPWDCSFTVDGVHGPHTSINVTTVNNVPKLVDVYPITHETDDRLSISYTQTEITGEGLGGGNDSSIRVPLKLVIVTRDNKGNYIYDQIVPLIDVVIKPELNASVLRTESYDGITYIDYAIHNPGDFNYIVRFGRNDTAHTYSTPVKFTGDQSLYTSPMGNLTLDQINPRAGLSNTCVKSKMTILIMTATGRRSSDPMYAAAVDNLQRMGINYEVITILDSNFNNKYSTLPLEENGESKYYGIILTHVFLAYRKPGTYKSYEDGWESAATSSQWSQIYTYATKYNIRLLALSSGLVYNVIPGIQISGSTNEDLLLGLSDFGKQYANADTINAEANTEKEYAVKASITSPSVLEFMKFHDVNTKSYIGPAAVVLDMPQGGKHLLSLFNNGPWMKSSKTFFGAFLTWLTDGVYVMQQFEEEQCSYDAVVETSCTNMQTKFTISSSDNCNLAIYGAEPNMFAAHQILLDSQSRSKNIFMKRCSSSRYPSGVSDTCGVCGGSGICKCDGILMDHDYDAYRIEDKCFSETVTPGTVCSVRCMDGWTVAGGYDKTTCQPNGVMAAPGLQCQAPTCNGLKAKIPYGTYISDGCNTDHDLHRSSCTIKCLNGYSPDGEKDYGLIRCRDGSYTAASFECNSDVGADRVSIGVIASAILIPIAALGLGFAGYAAYKRRKNRPQAGDEIDEHFPTSDNEMNAIDESNNGDQLDAQSEAREHPDLHTDEIPQVGQTPST